LTLTISHLGPEIWGVLKHPQTPLCLQLWWKTFCIVLKSLSFFSIHTDKTFDTAVLQHCGIMVRFFLTKLMWYSEMWFF